MGPFWLIRTRTIFTPLIGPAFQLPCPPAAWFTRARWTSVGPTQGILTGPRWLCTSLAIRGPAPALLSTPAQGSSDPASASLPSGYPGSWGQEGEAAPPKSCPARGLRTARLVPVSKWCRGGPAMSLTSQDGSFPVQGSRPEWEEACFSQVLYYSELLLTLSQFILILFRVSRS